MFKDLQPILAQETSLQGSDVSLLALLNARDKRASRQQTLLETYQQPVLSLTINAMGGVKRNPLLDYVFKQALKALERLFKAENITPIYQKITQADTGNEAIFSVNIPAYELKKYCVNLETITPLARLWDMDVIDLNGKPISRSDLGIPPRRCLICAENAKVCARQRSHSMADLMSTLQTLVKQDIYSQYFANQATNALCDEVMLTPKAGLVDAESQGAHKDMDVALLVKSAQSLTPYFAQCVQLGMDTAQELPSAVFPKLRQIGIQAEQAMFRTTKGVNTHKGAIFAFALCLCSLGQLIAQQDYQPFHLQLAPLCENVAALSAGITAELSNVTEPKTAGEILFKTYGVTGARGEAEQGFPLLRQLWQNRSAFAHIDPRFQPHYWLLYLMANNTDTNLLHRGGMAGLTLVQQQAKQLLNQLLTPAKLKTELKKFDQRCIQHNLSPGGSADILALAFFLNRVGF